MFTILQIDKRNFAVHSFKSFRACNHKIAQKCILCLCPRASMSIEQARWLGHKCGLDKGAPSQLAPRQGAPCLRVSRISPCPPCLLVAIMKLPTSFNSILCSSWTKSSSVTLTKYIYPRALLEPINLVQLSFLQNCPSLFPRAVCQTVPTSSPAGFKLSLKRYIQTLEIPKIFRKILNFL